MKTRLEREFDILVIVNELREAGHNLGTSAGIIERRIVALHLIELEMQEADVAIERITQEAGSK